MHTAASRVKDDGRFRWKVGLLAVSAAIAFALPMAATAPAHAAGTVYITFGFDDGSQSQFDNRDVLSKYGAKATYFINSGTIGSPGHMSWDQVRELQAEGNEIGGHTKTHKNLAPEKLNPPQPALTDAELNEQICDDHQATEAQLLTPVLDFAYPNGAFNDAAIQKLKDCGYQSARTTSGIDVPTVPASCEESDADADPPGCVWAESPTEYAASAKFDYFTLRAAQNHVNSLAGAPWDWTTSDDDGVKGRITRARNYRGGWVNIVLHDVCASNGDPNSCTSAFDGYDIPRDRLQKLAEWIATDPVNLKVCTTAEVIAMYKGGPACNRSLTLPPGAPAAAPPPAVAAASGGATLSVDPLARIAGARKASKRGWKLTIRLARPASAKNVQVLVDGRVAKTLTRLASSQSLTVRVGSGKHTVKLRTTATDGKVYTSATKTIGSKAKKKKKKK